MGATALLLAIALAVSGCKGVSSAPSTNSTSSAAAYPVATAGTNPAPDTSGDWVRPARDYASTRFSPLHKKFLGLAWVPADHAESGTVVGIRSGDKTYSAVIANEAFYDPEGKRLK